MRRSSVWCLAVVALLTTGCTFHTTRSPSTDEIARASATANGQREAAEELLGDLTAGRFDQAQVRMTASMRESFPSGELEIFWQDLVDQVGAFEFIMSTRMSDQFGDQGGTTDVAIVRARFERGVVDMQVAFDDASMVSGLLVRPVTTRR